MPHALIVGRVCGIIALSTFSSEIFKPVYFYCESLTPPPIVDFFHHCGIITAVESFFRHDRMMSADVRTSTRRECIMFTLDPLRNPRVIFKISTTVVMMIECT